jgi:hypothetical protein
MNVVNKDRFPHHYQIKKLGGFDTEKGEEYFEKYEKELNAEYDFYWNESIERFRFGGTKIAHEINENEHT